jgi:hypothetical protein
VNIQQIECLGAPTCNVGVHPKHLESQRTGSVSKFGTAVSLPILLN